MDNEKHYKTAENIKNVNHTKTTRTIWTFKFPVKQIWTTRTLQNSRNSENMLTSPPEKLTMFLPEKFCLLVLFAPPIAENCSSLLITLILPCASNILGVPAPPFNLPKVDLLRSFFNFFHELSGLIKTINSSSVKPRRSSSYILKS